MKSGGQRSGVGDQKMRRFEEQKMGRFEDYDLHFIDKSGRLLNGILITSGVLS